MKIIYLLFMCYLLKPELILNKSLHPSDGDLPRHISRVNSCLFINIPVLFIASQNLIRYHYEPNLI